MVNSVSATPTAAQASTPDATSAKHSRLVAAAQQFEAVMLGEMLKPLQKAGGGIGEEDDQESSGTMQSYGVEAVAGAMAKAGALGFAQRLVASVETREAGSQK